MSTFLVYISIWLVFTVIFCSQVYFEVKKNKLFSGRQLLINLDVVTQLDSYKTTQNFGTRFD